MQDLFVELYLHTALMRSNSAVYGYEVRLRQRQVIWSHPTEVSRINESHLSQVCETTRNVAIEESEALFYSTPSFPKGTFWM